MILTVLKLAVMLMNVVKGLYNIPAAFYHSVQNGKEDCERCC